MLLTVSFFSPLLSWAQNGPQPNLGLRIIVVGSADEARQILDSLKKGADFAYVVLISLDGFRYDYARKYHADHLLALAAQGASSPEGMLPAYPSITFPNHYSIITGLYPGHHGIVANNFYDPSRKEIYNYRDAKSVADGSWYGGTPLWVLAEQQGMRSAPLFWVGSEAEIQGVRPSYYLKFDDGFPNSKRVELVLAWLHLPPEQRPHFITVYFSDADTAGHDYGPDTSQVADAVHEIDRELGKLVDGIKESKLPVDLIVLADQDRKALRSAISVGRNLGDAFAWTFYQFDQPLLELHFKHQPNPHTPPGIGGRGELEFIRQARPRGFLMLYHGITNFLRIGDVSFFDPDTGRISAIAELKSRQVEPGKLIVRVHTISTNREKIPFVDPNRPLTKPENQGPVAMEAQFEATPERQMKKMAEVARHKEPDRTADLTSAYHTDELATFAEQLSLKGLAFQRFGMGAQW